MTPEDRAKLEVEFAKAQKREANARAKVERLRQLLACGCAHPEKYQAEYRWEHDNGYGRQTMIMGKRCSLCRAVG